MIGFRMWFVMKKYNSSLSYWCFKYIQKLLQMRHISMNNHAYTGYKHFTKTLINKDTLLDLVNVSKYSIVTPHQNSVSGEGAASDVLLNNICQKCCKSKLNSEIFKILNPKNFLISTASRHMTFKHFMSPF